jgi:hypothetical protein
MPPASLVRRLSSPARSWIRWSWLALPLLGATLLLADCGPKPNTFAPYCPTPRRLTDAARIALYRPGSSGRDITDLVLEGTITDVSGVCKDGDDKNTVQVDAAVTFQVTRGPAMQGNTVDVPYVVAVALGEDIKQEAAFRLRVTFPSNIGTVNLVSDPVHMVFPVTKTTNASSYTIWAFFRLTPEQLELNRQRGP